MGTNYYHITNECDCCGRYDVQHIGKKSGGWQFCFEATETLRSYDDWVAALQSGGRIEDEYGVVLSVAEFLQVVEQERGTGLTARTATVRERGYYGSPDQHEFQDQKGYRFNRSSFS